MEFIRRYIGSNNPQIGKFEQIKLIISCVVFTILVVSVANSYAMITAALCFSLWVIATLGEKEAFVYFIYITTLDTIYKFPGIQTSLVIVIVIAVFMKMSFKHRLAIATDLLLMMILFIAYIFAIGGLGSIPDGATVVVYVLMISLVTRGHIKVDARYSILAFCTGLIVTSTMALYSVYFPNVQFMMKSIEYKIIGLTTYRFAGIAGNPNWYSLLISIPVSILWVCILSRKTSLYENVCLVVLSILGLLSVSQSYIVGYAVVLIWIAVWAFNMNPIAFVRRFVVWAVVAVVLYIPFSRDIRAAYVARATIATSNLNDINTITNGRGDIWVSYLNYFQSNIQVLLFGQGLGSEYMEQRAPHNIVVESVYFMGITGTMIYIIMLLMAFNSVWRNVKFVQLLPIIVLIVRGMAINMVFNYKFYILLLLIAVFFKDIGQNHQISRTNSSVSERI